MTSIQEINYVECLSGSL